MNNKTKYLLLGAAFGLLFPVIATLIELTLKGVGPVEAQREQPLLWIIDTAPLFLGLFSMIAGMHADRISQLNLSLEESLQKSRTLNEGFFSNSALASFLTDESGMILTCNKAASALTKFQPDELVGKESILRLFVPEEIEMIAKLTTHLTGNKSKSGFQSLVHNVSDHHPHEFEARWVQKNGETVTVTVSISKVENVKVTTSGYLFIGHNITRQKATEDSFRESGRILKQILEVLPVGVYVLDANGRPFFANKRSTFLLGKGIVYEASPDQLTEIYQVYLSNTQVPYPTSKLPIVRALSGETATVEDLVLRHGEEDIELEVMGAPVFSPGGEVEFALAVFNDITDRKKIQRELRESELTLRTVFDSANSGIFLGNPSGMISRVNSAFCMMVGMSGERLRGKSFSSLVFPEFVEEVENAILKFNEGFKGTVQFQAKFHGAQNKILWGDVYFSAIRNERNNLLHFIIIVEDITFRRESEKKQQQLLDDLRQANQVLDNYSDNLRGLHGVLTSEFGSEVDQIEAILFTGCKVFGLEFGFVAEVKDEKVKLEVTSDQVPGFEPGMEFPLADTLASLISAKRESVHFHHASTDENFKGIKEHAAYKVETFIGTAVFLDNKFFGVLGFFSRVPHAFPFRPQDIEFIELLAGAVGRGLELRNSRIQIEQASLQLQKSNEELKKSNEGLDQFAYVVSHDLKAPLRGIQNLADWITEGIGSDATQDVKTNLSLLKNRVVRVTNLIDGILDYSRIGRNEKEFVSVDVGLLVAEVLDFFGKRDAVRIEIGNPLPVVRADRTQLSRVFINLIGNSIKYMDRPDGHIEIFSRSEGNFHSFCVKDNGPGIDPRHHEKVFGIFQRLDTKDEVEGTGIGLSIVKKIVEENGGSMKIESSLGNGAAFWFTWPV